MISVGVDVSKGKSTVCILKPYGEIVCSPFEVQHVEKDLDGLDGLLKKLDGEIRVVMEATGIYHLPVLTFLEEKGYFVSVINPFAMKKYAKDNSIRGAKTDKLDSTIIANYGIDKWFKLQKHEGDEETYSELKLLGRRYRYYMELHVKALQELTHILDYTMPGIKKIFNSWDEASGKDKLSDFILFGLKKRNTTEADQRLRPSMNWHPMVFLHCLPVPHRPKCWYRKQFQY